MAVKSLVITPDGRWVVTAGRQGVALVDAEAGRVDRGLLSSLMIPSVTVRLTDGGRVVRAAGRAWSLPDGRPVNERAPAWPAEVEDMRLDSAGGLWVAAHGRWWRRDGRTGEVTGPEVVVMGLDWQGRVRAEAPGLSWPERTPSPVDCGAVLSRWCAEPPGPVPVDFAGFDPREVRQVDASARR